MFPKSEIIRDRAWLDKVREMPCVVSGWTGGCDPAHIRHGFNAVAMKPSDNRVLPLRPDLHQRQHEIGEKAFWFEAMHTNRDFMMDCVVAYAEKLYRENNQ